MDKTPQQPSIEVTSPQNPTPASVPQVLTTRQRVMFVLRAIEIRLRFIALFAGIGLLMFYWRTLENYWDRWTRPDASGVAASSDSEFYCPMHPSVVRPGLEANGAVPSCPICGMPLSKRKKGEAELLPAGITSRVQLTPERVQLAGVKTVAAHYMPLTKEIRTVGYVAYDERRLSEIVTRAGGYLEQLYIDESFTTVENGEPLADIYSPELYSSIQELRLAKKHNSTELVASARQRLKLLGISDIEIDDALKGTDSRVRLTIRSPQSGHVIEKNVVEGVSVKSGDTLFKIADLSNVWVEADVYERDLGFVHQGQQVEATVEALPGAVFQGTVALVYPELNTETRTNRVRISIGNPELLLRPGMFATVRIQTPVSETEPFRTQLAARRKEPPTHDEAALIAFQRLCPVTGLKLGSMGKPVKAQIAQQTVYLCCAGCEDPLAEKPAEFLARLAPPPNDAVLSIPEGAVIDTGSQKIVFVERNSGVFEGVAVELGPRVGNQYPVLQGLAPGDRVVAAGAFLLDAETRLNPAAGAAYFGANGGPSDASSTDSQSTSASGQKTKQLSERDLANIAKLPRDDQQPAIAQMLCPITDEPLGSMGTPVKLSLEGETVFLCCKGCVNEARENSKRVIEKVKQRKNAEVSSEQRSSTPPAAHSH